MSINENHNVEDKVATQSEGAAKVKKKKYNSMTDPHPAFEPVYGKATTDQQRKIIENASTHAISTALQKINAGEGGIGHSGGVGDYGRISVDEFVDQLKLKAFNDYLAREGWKVDDNGVLVRSVVYHVYDPLLDLQPLPPRGEPNQVKSRMTMITTKTLNTLIKQVMKDTDRETMLHPFSLRETIKSDREDDVKLHIDAFMYVFVFRMANLCNNHISENLINYYIDFNRRMIADIENCNLDKYTVRNLATFIANEVTRVNKEIAEIYVKLSEKVDKPKGKVPTDFRRFNPRTHKYFAELVDARDEDIIEMETRLKYLHILLDK